MDSDSEVQPDSDSTEETLFESTASMASDASLAHTSFDLDSPPLIELDEESRRPALHFPVVGIGGSAGGLEAFTQLLRNVPLDTGMTFVIVQHLRPDHPSLLVQLLTRATRMPVSEARDATKLEPNHVYVIPPGYKMTLAEGALRLKKQPDDQRVQMPIDLFFRSLAADQHNRTIAIVMSGQDADGSLGLKAVKGEGGITIVQDERTAKFEDMPHAALIADNIDFVLSPAEIGEELGRIAKQFQVTTLPIIEAEPPTVQDRKDLYKIYGLLKTVSGVDFGLYKQNTIRRRLARRMVVKKADTLLDYLRLLQANPSEIRELHEDILINYTRFFRDPEAFETLSVEILPELLTDRPADSPLRIWVPGCSTGEETYSIAMCVLEYVANVGLDPAIHIFGTDLSERSIEKARHAIYPESIAAEIAKERMRRFFTKVERGYQVSKRVRDVCVFAKQNLGFDPPFSRLDIISCRNVLIYFGGALQRTVLATFHYALNSSGILMLGNSENIRDRGDLFTPVDKKHRVYRRNPSVSPRPLLDVGGRRYPPNYDGITQHAPSDRIGGSEIELQWAADRIVLARYGPCGVVVDENLEVLQSRGHTGAFLELQPGTATLNLLRMAREGVRLELRDAMQKAISEGVPVHVPNLRIDSEGQVREFAVEVLPIHNLPPGVKRFLVLFATTAQQTSEYYRELLKRQPSEESRDDKDRRIRQLEQDLVATKLYLQSLVEERDSTNQELVSANEEIQSRNEELQSINEELETAKEELQSTNEEVQTVNEELSNRNAELSQTSNDLRNLLNNTTLPVLMLDNELRIRQFTNAAERLMNLRVTDVGRPIREIRMELSVEDLEPLLVDVIETLSTREIEVQDRGARWHQMRIRPYRTMDNRIDGVVMVMIDIHDIRKSKEELATARDFAQAVVESVQLPLVALTADCRVVMANKAMAALVGNSVEDLRGRQFCDLVEELWGMRKLREPLRAMGHAEAQSDDFQLEHAVENGEYRVLLAKSRLVPVDGNRALLLTVEDITARKKAELLTLKEKERLEGKVQITEQALGRTQEELRALAASLFTAQEEERRRVARELHDDLSQKMAMLEVDVQRLEQQLPDGTLHEQLSQLRTQTGGLSNDLRRIAHQLHPGILDDLGLGFALKALAEEFSERHEIPVRYTSNALPENIPSGLASCVYRVTQEALRNVAKHAGHTPVRITLNGTSEGLRLVIRDMGNGFDTRVARQHGGLGIISMQERVRLIGGRISIRSSPGNGTTINVRVPLPAGGTEA